MDERAGERDALLLAAESSFGRRLGAMAEAERGRAAPWLAAPPASWLLPAASSGTATFSAAVSAGSRLYCWNTKPEVLAAEEDALGVLQLVHRPAEDPELAAASARAGRRSPRSASSCRSRSVRPGSSARRSAPRSRRRAAPRRGSRPRRSASSRARHSTASRVASWRPHPRKTVGRLEHQHAPDAEHAGDDRHEQDAGAGAAPRSATSARCRGSPGSWSVISKNVAAMPVPSAKPRLAAVDGLQQDHPDQARRW